MTSQHSTTLRTVVLGADAQPPGSKNSTPNRSGAKVASILIPITGGTRCIWAMLLVLPMLPRQSLAAADEVDGADLEPPLGLEASADEEDGVDLEAEEACTDPFDLGLVEEETAIMTSKVDSPEPVGVVLDLDDLVAGVTADGGAAGDGVALVWDINLERGSSSGWCHISIEMVNSSTRPGR